MFRKLILISVLSLFLLGAFACGNKGNIWKVCDAIFDGMYNACDVENTTDRAILLAALQGLGFDITDSTIQNLSKAEGISSCDYEFKVLGSEFTDEEAALALFAISQFPKDCAGYVTSFSELVNEL